MNLKISAPVKNCGPRVIGASYAMIVTLENEGTTPIAVNSAIMTGDNQFTMKTTVPASFAPGASGTITITFKAAKLGEASCKLTIDTSEGIRSFRFEGCGSLYDLATGGKGPPVDAFASVLLTDPVSGIATKTSLNAWGWNSTGYRGYWIQAKNYDCFSCGGDSRDDGSTGDVKGYPRILRGETQYDANFTGSGLPLQLSKITRAQVRGVFTQEFSSMNPIRRSSILHDYYLDDTNVWESGKPPRISLMIVQHVVDTTYWYQTEVAKLSTISVAGHKWKIKYTTAPWARDGVIIMYLSSKDGTWTGEEFGQLDTLIDIKTIFDYLQNTGSVKLLPSDYLVTLAVGPEPISGPILFHAIYAAWSLNAEPALSTL